MTQEQRNIENLIREALMLIAYAEAYEPKLMREFYEQVGQALEALDEKRITKTSDTLAKEISDNLNKLEAEGQSQFENHYQEFGSLPF